MQHITFEKKIKSDVERAFKISTDYANLNNVTNKFYTLANVRSSRENATIVSHRVNILDKSLAVMIKHVVEKPYVHKSHWVGGDAKGSIVIEMYEKSENGTVLYVDAKLKLPITLAIKSIFSFKKLESNLHQMADGIALAAES
ncbi:MAG: hypothetical protein K8823_913 [Cenarchaeum symbiont of Oopsacas minuta]|nr:hypothetical protein [Cenarchaeum symbiont of Oopsacas minuta]